MFHHFFSFFLYIASILAVTANPPKMLTEARTSASGMVVAGAQAKKRARERWMSSDLSIRQEGDKVRSCGTLHVWEVLSAVRGLWL